MPQHSPKYNPELNNRDSRTLSWKVHNMVMYAMTRVQERSVDIERVGFAMHDSMQTIPVVCVYLVILVCTSLLSSHISTLDWSCLTR